MRPIVIGAVLSGLFCITITIYFFHTPHELRAVNGSSTLHAKGGMWGVHDAEFNWCEVDYECVQLALPTSPLDIEDLRCASKPNSQFPTTVLWMPHICASTLLPKLFGSLLCSDPSPGLLRPNANITDGAIGV